MSSDLTKLKECSNCSAFIEARAKSCHICNIVFEIPILTNEEENRTYKEVCEELNNAFFRFENFMYGSATTYESFNFDRAFTVLFIKTRETKNYTPNNFLLLDQYWSLTNQIQYDLDKCNFDNTLALDNTAFETDSNSICAICHKRLHEFLEFSLPEDITTERRLSIVDIKAGYSEESSKDKKKKNSGAKSKKKKKQKDTEDGYSKLIADIEFVFKHNYPGFEKPMQFYYNAKESLRKFKYLTPLNLKGFSDTDLKLALKHFAVVTNELLTKAFTNFETIEKWLVKYRIPYHSLFHDSTRNELVNFLNEKLPSLKFSLPPEYNKNQEHIQYDFFNYWYGSFLLEASIFIQELTEVVSPEKIDRSYKSDLINVSNMAVKQITLEFIFPNMPKSIMDSFPKHLLKVDVEKSNDTELQPKIVNSEDVVKKYDSSPLETERPFVPNMVEEDEDSAEQNVDYLKDVVDQITEYSGTRDSDFSIKPNNTVKLVDLSVTAEYINPLNLDPTSFTEIFTEQGWQLYINALHEIEIKLIDKQYNYIGKEREKGVVCSWIKLLQTKGIINRKLKRQQLATVLNNELKGFNLGLDGKTFDNHSKVFAEKFEKILLKHTKLLP